MEGVWFGHVARVILAYVRVRRTRDFVSGLSWLRRKHQKGKGENESHDMRITHTFLHSQTYWADACTYALGDCAECNQGKCACNRWVCVHHPSHTRKSLLPGCETLRSLQSNSILDTPTRNDFSTRMHSTYYQTAKPILPKMLHGFPWLAYPPILDGAIAWNLSVGSSRSTTSNCVRAILAIWALLGPDRRGILPSWCNLWILTRFFFHCGNSPRSFMVIWTTFQRASLRVFWMVR